MSDARLQDIRRSAALGDPGAEARLLVEGLRAGLLTRERVELAAYCGHKAARVALGNGPHDWLGALPGGGPTVLGVDLMPLERWVQGLSRWECLNRAAVAAGRAALPVSDEQWGEMSRWKRARAAIEAAEAWLDCPCEEHRVTWALLAYGEWGPPMWLMRPAALDGYPGDDPVQCILAAAHLRLLGEQPVREAIQSALVAWALGEQP